MNKTLMAAMLALTAISVPAVAQPAERHERGERHPGADRTHGDRDGDRDRWGNRRGDYERHRGGYRGRDRLDNRRYTQRWDRQWDRRWRDRGNACDYMGYSRGCRSYSSDGAYIIFRLFENLYCYRRAPYGAYQVACPRNWYDY